MNRLLKLIFGITITLCCAFFVAAEEPRQAPDDKQQNKLSDSESELVRRLERQRISPKD